MKEEGALFLEFFGAFSDKFFYKRFVFVSRPFVFESDRIIDGNRIIAVAVERRVQINTILGLFGNGV
jgi:hypothetical protein